MPQIYRIGPVICHMSKEVVGKFSFRELKIEKEKFLTQSPIPNF